jgi:ATP-dependent RNA helicase RhlE
LFSRTKYNARNIARSIREMGHTSAEIHSNRSLNQRREALDGFKSGKYKVLVATDIAARGIDVTGIELVLNYDLPEDA